LVIFVPGNSLGQEEPHNFVTSHPFALGYGAKLAM
jgi:hypothetical protein